MRYSKDHNSGEEYFYNDPDKDDAKTVWARDIPGMDLTPLLSYFKNRDMWVYEPDVDDESVTLYSSQPAVPPTPSPCELKLLLVAPVVLTPSAFYRMLEDYICRRG